jgi:hypothetical protein
MIIFLGALNKIYGRKKVSYLQFIKTATMMKPQLAQYTWENFSFQNRSP